MEMLVWSGGNALGALASGGAWDAAKNRWRTLSNPGSATARHASAGVWSGTELVVFGGRQDSVVGALERLNPQPEWHLYRKP